VPLHCTCCSSSLCHISKPGAPDGSHQNWVQEKEFLCWPAVNALPNITLEVVDVCWEGTVLACGQLFVLQNPQIPFCRDASHPVVLIMYLEVIPWQTQDFAFLLVEYHVIPFSLILQPIQLPLNGSTLNSSAAMLYHLQTSWTCTLSKHSGH